MKNYFTFILLLLCKSTLFGITDSLIIEKNKSDLDSININNAIDSIDSVDYSLNEVVVFGRPKVRTQNERLRYNYIKRRIRRIYPFMMKSFKILENIEKQKKKLSPKQRDIYISRAKKYLDTKFRDTLMHFTAIEARVFSKMIYRHTGKSVYLIIKENLGVFSAFWWNTLANLFSIEIDEEYCPSEIQFDSWIENILKELLLYNQIKELPDSKGYCKMKKVIIADEKKE